MGQLILCATILFLIILLAFWYSTYGERFNIPKNPQDEYIPQNMSRVEWKTINKWDYPSYMNADNWKKEKFGNIYPGGRGDVNCVDADWAGAGGQCDPMGPYITDPKIDFSGIPGITQNVEMFRGGGSYSGGREDIDCIENPTLGKCQVPGSFYYW
jgi:hypothetical protein